MNDHQADAGGTGRKKPFPREILHDIAKADLFGTFVPEEYGGLGGAAGDCLVLEELAGAASAWPPVAASSWASFRSCSPAQRSRSRNTCPISPVARRWAAFGLTEANAGSDAGGIRTTAVQDGDDWVLNGTKQWITNGGEAEIYSVVALTDPSKGARGASIFVVETGTPVSPTARRRTRWASAPPPPAN